MQFFFSWSYYSQQIFKECLALYTQCNTSYYTLKQVMEMTFLNHPTWFTAGDHIIENMSNYFL